MNSSESLMAVTKTPFSRFFADIFGIQMGVSESYGQLTCWSLYEGTDFLRSLLC